VTYPKVILWFVVPAIAVLLGLVVALRRPLPGRFFKALGVLLAIVYVATIPWDNLAVRWGIWFFDWEKTWGIRWLYLPLEEYLFFGLETILAALVWHLLGPKPPEATP
jgi:lycopene cyclase domain-containing protein